MTAETPDTSNLRTTNTTGNLRTTGTTGTTDPDRTVPHITESSESSESSGGSGAELGPDAGRDGAWPVLSIVSGQPTAEETAAVVVVLTALASHGDAAPPARPAPSQWSARSRFLRAPVRPGPDAWRASALPR